MYAILFNPSQIETFKESGSTLAFGLLWGRSVAEWGQRQSYDFNPVQDTVHLFACSSYDKVLIKLEYPLGKQTFPDIG